MSQLVPSFQVSWSCRDDLWGEWLKTPCPQVLIFGATQSFSGRDYVVHRSILFEWHSAMATATSTNTEMDPSDHNFCVSHAPSQSPSQKTRWQARRRMSNGSTRSERQPDPADEDHLSPQNPRVLERRGSTWWRVCLFRGMVDDVKRRLPYYWSDWKDAWDYRVVPATVYMYFAKYGHSMPLFAALVPLESSYQVSSRSTRPPPCAGSALLLRVFLVSLCHPLEAHMKLLFVVRCSPCHIAASKST